MPGGALVAIIDDQEVVRTGLESWLGRGAVARVVGSFAQVIDYLAWLPKAPRVRAVIAEVQTLRQAPDFDGLRVLCRSGPPVIVYSRWASDEIILASIEAGALSFVSKSEDRDHLIQAVRCAVQGKPYAGPLMAQALARRNLTGRTGLSEREKEVLVAWLESDTKEEVGRRLNVAPGTVKTYIHRIRTKYANIGRPASTKAALLKRAIEDGLVGVVGETEGE